MFSLSLHDILIKKEVGEKMIDIKTDSRKVIPGDTFVALKGVLSDGDTYIQNAIENGATKIIADHGSYSVQTIIVKDTREYLENYLKEHYQKYLQEMTIIGITGTNGKSTITMLIYQAMKQLNIPCGAIGTLGFYLEDKVCSLPNTSPDICEVYDLLLQAYEKGYRYFVMEASSWGLLSRRLEGIPYDYTIYSNLTEDHLNQHYTMDNYALAKQILFKKLKPNGKAIINIDDAYCSYFLLEENQNITYGLQPSNYQLVKYSLKGEYTDFDYKYGKEKIHIETPLIGSYNIYNLLAVIALLHELQIEKEKIIEICSNVSLPEGRMEKITYLDNNIVIDYAHTEDAMRKIIEASKIFTKGNLYIVFGCIGEREREKRPIMTKLATDEAKYVIITRDDPHYEDENRIINDMISELEKDNYEVCLDRKQAIQKGISLLEHKDTLLVLGKGHEEGIIIKDKVIPFNDRKIIHELLQTM